MSRPRKFSDDDIFAALGRAMGRVGPGELSLAVIASEAGVTPAALVHRFGSKRALLLSFAERAARDAGSLLDALRREHSSPTAVLRAYAECMGDLARSPAALARSLAYLQTDLSDDGLRAPLRRQALASRAAIRRIIREAVAAGELRATTDAAALARTVEHVVSGALLTWAVYQDAPARKWMRTALDELLTPHLSRRRR